jgi:hypothetical protein
VGHHNPIGMEEQTQQQKQKQKFSWEEKLVAPLIATPNGVVRK